MNKKNLSLVLLPLSIALSICLGIWLGKYLSYGKKEASAVDKFNTVLGLIQQQYVDTIDVNELVELSIPELLAQLDPHSAYIPKKDLTGVNDELEGSFSGVGVSFQITNDTVVVIDVINEGPAEKVGILPGDRIVYANDKLLAGSKITNEDVFKTLRGKKGTRVFLKIKRTNSPKLLSYDVVRGDIPDKSVNAAYLLDDKKTGFVKIGKFSRTTYDEFMNAMTTLADRGAKQFIIDLRDNSGGYMDQAIMMANEFLDDGKMIVYTRGRLKENETCAYADGLGSFLQAPLAVLTNEFSASASEIFAGAMQDNDRGIIVGRRTFGKGLVQNQIMLSDSSAIRLTVARYYTPSGRSIQKEYHRGQDGKYQLEIADRYNHGEFYNKDSIKQDRSKLFYTALGRPVYGGGGIMPDLFVAEDTIGISSYYINVVNAGLIQRFAFDVTDKYRSVLSGVKKSDMVLNIIPRDETMLKNFVDFGVENSIPARWYYIRQSSNLLLHNIKAMIVRNVLGYNEFYRIYYQNDPNILKAVDALNNNLLQQMLKSNENNKKKNNGKK